MKYTQIQIANCYINESKENEILKSKNELSMLSFSISVSAQTYYSKSFVPGSISTATSISIVKKLGVIV